MQNQSFMINIQQNLAYKIGYGYIFLATVVKSRCQLGVVFSQVKKKINLNEGEVGFLSDCRYSTQP